MILPDHEIRKYLADGRLVIEPLDEPDVQIQPACVDLRLGNEFKVFKHTHEPFIDSKAPGDYTETVRVEDRPFVLHPGEFVLGVTMERIRIPADLAACVDGRSSLGRLGITAHITSSWIDPGFEGVLVLEVTNIGKMPVTLHPGMRICKLILMKLTSPAERPYNLRKGKYRGQSGVEQSRIHED